MKREHGASVERRGAVATPVTVCREFNGIPMRGPLEIHKSETGKAIIKY